VGEIIESGLFQQLWQKNRSLVSQKI